MYTCVHVCQTNLIILISGTIISQEDSPTALIHYYALTPSFSVILHTQAIIQLTLFSDSGLLTFLRIALSCSRARNGALHIGQLLAW